MKRWKRCARIGTARMRAVTGEGGMQWRRGRVEVSSDRADKGQTVAVRGELDVNERWEKK